MKSLAWTLSALLALVFTVPVDLILFVTTIAAPAAAAGCTPPTSASGMPQPGNPRQASLSNPPTEIPAPIQALYEAAATRYGLPWSLLAGIGMEETNHGRNTATSSAGAQGLMQFMPATFAAYGVDGNGDGRATITDEADSIYSAANYLVASGALTGPAGIRQALYAYNHALWYVNDVLYYAASYSDGDLAANPCITYDTATTGTPITGTGPTIDAVRAALAWIGTPYSWGGGNDQGPTVGICCSPGGHDDRHIVGFDCSGLVLYAYAQIGIHLPHLAHDISYHSAGQPIPRDFTQMKPGDTIGFSYTPGGNVFHIGLYLGGGQMVNSDSHGVSIASLLSGYYSRLAWHVVRFVT
jgi:cell wall-associated NlpC family hydrolase